MADKTAILAFIRKRAAELDSETQKTKKSRTEATAPAATSAPGDDETCDTSSVSSLEVKKQKGDKKQNQQQKQKPEDKDKTCFPMPDMADAPPSFTAEEVKSMGLGSLNTGLYQLVDEAKSINEVYLQLVRCGCCKGIPRFPVLTACNHCLCNECRLTAVTYNRRTQATCPVKNCGVKFFMESNPTSVCISNPLVWGFVEKERAKCRYSVFGCDFVDYIKTLAVAHESKCKFAPVQCGPCKLFMAQEHVGKHMNKYCAAKRMQCQFCGTIVSIDMQLVHERHCRGGIVVCRDYTLLTGIPKRVPGGHWLSSRYATQQQKKAQKAKEKAAEVYEKSAELPPDEQKQLAMERAAKEARDKESAKLWAAVPERGEDVGGCTARMRLTELAEHVTKCPLRRRQCFYARYGCDFVGTPAQMVLHNKDPGQVANHGRLLRIAARFSSTVATCFMQHNRTIRDIPQRRGGWRVVEIGRDMWAPLKQTPVPTSTPNMPGGVEPEEEKSAWHRIAYEMTTGAYWQQGLAVLNTVHSHIPETDPAELVCGYMNLAPPPVSYAVRLVDDRFDNQAFVVQLPATGEEFVLPGSAVMPVSAIGEAARALAESSFIMQPSKADDAWNALLGVYFEDKTKLKAISDPQCLPLMTTMIPQAYDKEAEHLYDVFVPEWNAWIAADWLDASSDRYLPIAPTICWSSKRQADLIQYMKEYQDAHLFFQGVGSDVSLDTTAASPSFSSTVAEKKTKIASRKQYLSRTIHVPDAVRLPIGTMTRFDADSFQGAVVFQHMLRRRYPNWCNGLIWPGMVVLVSIGDTKQIVQVDPTPQALAPHRPEDIWTVRCDPKPTGRSHLRLCIVSAGRQYGTALNYTLRQFWTSLASHENVRCHMPSGHLFGTYTFWARQLGATMSILESRFDTVPYQQHAWYDQWTTALREYLTVLNPPKKKKDSAANTSTTKTAVSTTATTKSKYPFTSYLSPKQEEEAKAAGKRPWSFIYLAQQRKLKADPAKELAFLEEFYNLPMTQRHRLNYLKAQVAAHAEGDLATILAMNDEPDTDSDND